MRERGGGSNKLEVGCIGEDSSLLGITICGIEWRQIDKIGGNYFSKAARPIKSADPEAGWFC